jgi:hypothetical protein
MHLLKLFSKTLKAKLNVDKRPLTKKSGNYLIRYQEKLIQLTTYEKIVVG